ncbi:MAG: LytTR family DNA-binding domain-containing protein [Bryobacter sp.]|nr:LytTR family DNA-binding domain-containing protein [Bryobacter sp. CoA8 C33]
MTTPRNILIVDDEAPARQRLRALLQPHGLITEAANGRAAVDLLQSHHFDLVFLDIQMPEIDGLSVVHSIGVSRMPLTVFVTAYDCYAIQAFDAHALDYLLKPFSDERFESTLQRLLARLSDPHTNPLASRLEQLLQSLSPHRPLDRFVVKSAGATHFLDVSEIDWIEAAGIYLTLHLGSRSILHSGFTLAQLESRLDPRLFIRVHRSAIVRIDRIARLEPISHGEFEIVLKGGVRLRLSRTYRPRLEQLLGQSL